MVDTDLIVKLNELPELLRRAKPGKQLKTLRLFQGLTQQEASEPIGCSRSELINIEAGKTPSVRYQEKIKEIYGVEWI